MPMKFAVQENVNVNCAGEPDKLEPHMVAEDPNMGSDCPKLGDEPSFMQDQPKKKVDIPGHRDTKEVMAQLTAQKPKEEKKVIKHSLYQ